MCKRQWPLHCNLYRGHAGDESDCPYRSLLGQLLWIARMTRPDIFYAVIYMSQFTASHTKEHFKHLKRILKYLISTKDQCLTYVRQQGVGWNDISITAWSDSDWASDAMTRRSVTGCCTFVCGMLVSWVSKRQTTVALSSTEAEYMAVSDTNRDVIQVMNILSEFCKPKLPSTIFMDNVGAKFIAENSVNNKRTKHIDVRFHYIRQYVQRKLTQLVYVPTQYNLADMFTKALGPEKFLPFMRQILGLEKPWSSEL